MTRKDIDFTKVSLPADEFDSMMRGALNAPAPPDHTEKESEKKVRKPKVLKTTVSNGDVNDR